MGFTDEDIYWFNENNERDYKFSFSTRIAVTYKSINVNFLLKYINDKIKLIKSYENDESEDFEPKIFLDDIFEKTITNTKYITSFNISIIH